MYRANKKGKGASITPYMHARNGQLKNYQQQGILSGSVLKENDKGRHHVGLKNRGATCYLNTLIQTLFMTPEFRKGVYGWCGKEFLYDERNTKALEQNSTSLELKKLFVELETSKECAVSTDKLTATFNWPFSPYEQRDLPAMLRALFEKLSLEGHKEFLQKLFMGTAKDLTFCKYCDDRISRNNEFIELTLSIWKEYGREFHRTIIDAIKAFVKVQPLDGDVPCRRCTILGHAASQMRITNFPEILLINVNRGHYDATSRKTKINHRLEFADFLNLNDIVANANNDIPSLSGSDKSSADCRWLNVTNDSSTVQNMLKSGIFVYELFSVIVHQGGYCSGHYYAYIKDLDKNQWLCFNDSSVIAVSPDDVQKAFCDFYLLVYRRVPKQQNLTEAPKTENNKAIMSSAWNSSAPADSGPSYTAHCQHQH